MNIKLNAICNVAELSYFIASMLDFSILETLIFISI